MLALWQAEYVKAELLKHHPDLQIELVPLTSRGDKILDVPLAKVGGKGLFVKELEQALLANETLGREEFSAIVDVPRVNPPTTVAGKGPVRDAAATSAGFISTKYLGVLVAGVVVLICGGLFTLRSTLKTTGPRAASDPFGRTSCN